VEGNLIRIGAITQTILQIRGEKIIIDRDLADFYGVRTRRLNEQVKRNKNRFPKDFMFQLTADEKSEVVAKCDHLVNLKYSRALPYAFTEHGALMVASVLNTTRAAEISVFIVRAFVKLRTTVSENSVLSHQLTALERRLTGHDQQIMALVQTIKKLMSSEPVPKKRQIGFT